MKILVADDSDLIRIQLIRLISSLASRIIIDEAASIAQAKVAIKNNKPDIIILDLRMPDGSGFEILHLIKRLERKPIVIILTNYSNELYKKKSIEEGADYFFDKSTEFDKVINILNSQKNNSD